MAIYKPKLSPTFPPYSNPPIKVPYQSLQTESSILHSILFLDPLTLSILFPGLLPRNLTKVSNIRMVRNLSNSPTKNSRRWTIFLFMVSFISSSLLLLSPERRGVVYIGERDPTSPLTHVVAP